MDASDGDMEQLRAIVGELPDSHLRALLARSGGDVAAAANRYFDNPNADYSANPPACFGEPADSGANGGLGEDVLGPLFKTIEDQGRKLVGARPLRHLPASACRAA